MSEPVALRRDLARLSPAQQHAYDAILGLLPTANWIQFSPDSGHGRTTVLRRLHQELGGIMLTIRDFVDAERNCEPLALENAIFEPIMGALRKNAPVFVDDFHVASEVMHGCHFYPRSGWLNAPLSAVAAYVAETGKKLIVGSDCGLHDPLRQRSIGCGMRDFEAEDYAHFLQEFAGDELANRIDPAKVHRFAPNLSAHQLRSACHWLQQANAPDTEAFIEYLRLQQLTSNVELGEVTSVQLSHLRGVDDVIRSLEASVVLPLEHDDIASELQWQPKRGVLLVGPPGTGKTTVGRALAHRLRGKFFGSSD